MSAREQISAAIDALLTLSPGVTYEAEPSGDPDTFPALHSYDGGDTPIETESGTTRLRMTITIEGFVEAGSGATARAARNALHADAVQLLMQDPTLTGFVESIELVGDLRLDTAELASKRRLGFAQDFAIQYATPRGDPHQLA